MNTPVRVQFAKAGNLYRLDVSVSPILPREVPHVVEAFTTHWSKPEEVDRSKVNDATAITMSADHEIRAGERPADIARKLTYAIWQKLDRYVKVTVEATYLGETPDAHFEYGESAYSDAFEARFEG
ncbi:MAG: hypothetical protein ABI905_04320 [Betaproteobacteria bacterium]